MFGAGAEPARAEPTSARARVDPPTGERMRVESWIADAPPEVDADAHYSEHDDALESERLESLISTLRQRATRRPHPASWQSGRYDSAGVRAAREMLGEAMASD